MVSLGAILKIRGGKLRQVANKGVFIQPQEKKFPVIFGTVHIFMSTIILSMLTLFNYNELQKKNSVKYEN